MGERQPPFCDADGDAASFSSLFARTAADAVLVFAHAMHAMQDGSGNLDHRDAAGMYEQLLALPSGLEGLSGVIRLDDAGERAGSFEVVNLQAVDSRRDRRDRRLSVSFDQFSAEFVRLGAYDTVNGMQVPASDDDAEAIFHGDTRAIPADTAPTVAEPTCGESGLDESDFFAWNVSSCAPTSGHALAFYWAQTPPGDGCELPANETMACSYEPRESPTALALTVVGIGVPCAVVPFLLGLALVRAAARLTEKRKRKREGGDGDGDQSFSRWMAAAMARGCAVLGALALCAAPLVLAGENSRGACTSRLAVRALGPALVAFGITAGDAHDARLALVRAAARLAEKRKRKREGGDGKGDGTRVSRWLAAAMALEVVAFVLLCALVACVVEWAADDRVTLPEDVERETVVTVRGAPEVLKVNVTQCPLEWRDDDSGAWRLGRTAWQIDIALLVCAGAAQLLRVLSAGQLDVPQGPSSVSFLALMVCSFYAVGFWQSGAMGTGASSYPGWVLSSLCVGWLALAAEVVSPALRRYLAAKSDQKMLLLDHEGQRFRPKEPVAGAEGSHIFLSHTQSTGQDQVQTMYANLLTMCPELRVWLDTEKLDEISAEKLRAAVKASDVVLVFLSQKYLASEFCRVELCTAREQDPKIPIVLVRESSADKGGIKDIDDLITPVQVKAIEDKLSAAQAANRDGAAAKKLKSELDAIKYVKMKLEKESDTILWFYRIPGLKWAMLKRVVELACARVSNRQWLEKEKREEGSFGHARQPTTSRTAIALAGWGALRIASGRLRIASGEVSRRASGPASSRGGRRAGGDISGGASASGEPSGASDAAGSCVTLEASETSAADREPLPGPLKARRLFFKEELRKKPPPGEKLRLFVSHEYPEPLRTGLERAFGSLEHVKIIGDDPTTEPRLERRLSGVDAAVICLFDLSDDADAKGHRGKSFFHCPELVRLARHTPPRPHGLLLASAASTMAVARSPTIGWAAPSSQRGSQAEASAFSSSMRSSPASVPANAASRSPTTAVAALPPNLKMVLVYSVEQRFADYMSGAREKAQPEIKNFGGPLWQMWPLDAMMQAVAADIEIEKLVDTRRNAERRRGPFGWRTQKAATRPATSTSTTPPEHDDAARATWQRARQAAISGSLTAHTTSSSVSFQMSSAQAAPAPAASQQLSQQAACTAV